MGNLQSQNFDQSQFTSKWQFKERNSVNHAIYQHKQISNLQIQQYPIFARSEEDVNDFRQLYDLRKNNQELVKAYYLKEVHQSGMCSNGAQGKLYLERIEIRLSNLEHVPYPDVLHLYFNALKGYRLLTRKIGWFRPQQEQVGFNYSGQCKVWLSHEFAAIHTTIFQGSQSSMVYKVLQMIEDNTDQQTFPHSCPNVTQYILQNTDQNKLTFDDALIRLREYGNAYNQGQIPRFMECIKQVGVEAIARSLKENGSNVHESQLKRQEHINMKRSQDQFLNVSGSIMHPSSSENNLKKNQGNFKSMNHFTPYQSVSSARNSMILQNNVTIAPTNFTKPQSVIIEQKMPLTQGYRKSQPFQPPQIIQQSFRPSVQISTQVSNQRLSVSLNKVQRTIYANNSQSTQVPFVQSPPQVIQINKLPEKQLIRSPVKMIVQSPISHVNGVIRSPVQYQPHQIHTWQQETTSKFTQPMNHVNPVVSHKKLPVQTQQIIIPQQPNQLTHVVHLQSQQPQNVPTINSPQNPPNPQTNQAIPTQNSNLPTTKPQPIIQQHTNEQVQIQEPSSEQENPKIQDEPQGHEVHEESIEQGQNQPQIEPQQQSLIKQQQQAQQQQQNLRPQIAQLESEQPIIKLQQFISNDQLESQPNTRHVIQQPEQQARVAQYVQQAQTQPQQVKQVENNGNNSQQPSQGHPNNSNQDYLITQTVINQTNHPNLIPQSIPVVINNQHQQQIIQPIIVANNQANKLVQFNSSMNSQAIHLIQVNNHQTISHNQPQQLNKPIIIQPAHLPRQQPVIINNHGQFIRPQHQFIPTPPAQHNILPPQLFTSPTQQFPRPSTLVNHPMVLNQVTNVSSTVRPQQLGSIQSQVVFNRPTGGNTPSVPMPYYNTSGPQMINRGPQQIILNAQIQQIPVSSQPVRFVQMGNGQQQQMRQATISSNLQPQQQIQPQLFQKTVNVEQQRQQPQEQGKQEQKQVIECSQGNENEIIEEDKVSDALQAQADGQPQEQPELKPCQQQQQPNNSQLQQLAESQPYIEQQPIQMLAESQQQAVHPDNLLHPLQPQLKLVVSTQQHLLVGQVQIQGQQNDGQQMQGEQGEWQGQGIDLKEEIGEKQVQSQIVHGRGIQGYNDVGQQQHDQYEEQQQYESRDIQYDTNAEQQYTPQQQNNLRQQQNYQHQHYHQQQPQPQYHQQHQSSQQQNYLTQQQQQHLRQQQRQVQEYQRQQQQYYQQDQRQQQQYQQYQRQQLQQQQLQQQQLRLQYQQQEKKRRQFLEYVEYQRRQVEEYQMEQQRQREMERQYLEEQRKLQQHEKIQDQEQHQHQPHQPIHSQQPQTDLYHPILSSRANNVINSNTVSVQIPTLTQYPLINQHYQQAHTLTPSSHPTPEQIFHNYSALPQPQHSSQSYQVSQNYMKTYKQQLYDNLDQDNSRQIEQLQDMKQPTAIGEGTYSNQQTASHTQPQPQLQLSQQPDIQKPSYTYQAQKYTLPANPTQFTYTPDLYQPLPTAKTPVNEQKHYQNTDHSPIMEYMEYEDLKRKKSQLQKQLMMLDDGHSIKKAEDRFFGYSQNDYIESSNSGYFNVTAKGTGEDYIQNNNKTKTQDYAYKPFTSSYQQANTQFNQFSFNPKKYDFTSASQYPQTSTQPKEQFKSMSFGSSTNYKDINLDDGKSSMDILNAIKGVSSTKGGNNLVESGLVMNSSKFTSKNNEVQGQYSFLNNNKSAYLNNNEENPYKFNENFSTSKVKYDKYDDFCFLPTVNNSTRGKDYGSIGGYDYFPGINAENKYQFSQSTNLNTFTGSRLKQKQPAQTYIYQKTQPTIDHSLAGYDMTVPTKSYYEPNSYLFDFGTTNKTQYSNRFQSQRVQSNSNEQNQYQVDYDPEILADLQKLN